MSTNEKNKKVQMETNENSKSSNWLKYLVSFLVVGFLALIIGTVQERKEETASSNNAQRLFTIDELKKFTEEKLYLSILGHVFDVSSAARFYSKSGSYSHFTGRDASRSFHTGLTSEEELTDDLTGLNDESVGSVFHWLEFYRKNYPEIGKLIGRYFKSDGSPSEHFFNVLQSVEKVKKIEEEKNNFERAWPPCNSEWSQATGRRVWCSKKSGGIERNWIGFPRRFFDKATRNERCVCVEDLSKIDGRFKEFSNCPSSSVECRVPEQ